MEEVVVVDMTVLIVGLLEEVSQITKHSTSQAHLLKLTQCNTMTCTHFRTGPVTDYTSSMVKWMRHRQPRYKGGGRMEMERPSPSYTVDVCSYTRTQASADSHVT